MSDYYYRNRKELLKKAHDKYQIKVTKKEQRSIIRLTNKKLIKKKEVNTDLCLKMKKKS